MKTEKMNPTLWLPGGLALTALSSLLVWEAVGQSVPAPVLKATMVSTNMQVTITNGVSTAIYELYWTPELNSSLYPWMWLAVGNQGQTNFLFDISSTYIGFIEAKVGNDTDSDGIVDWQDSKPNDASKGILTVTIESPANGSTIMLARNSSRSRNGHRSSSGFDTNVPSGRWTDDSRGARLSSGITRTSQMTGPGMSSTRRTSTPRFDWSQITADFTPNAAATLLRSGTVRPVAASAPIRGSPK